MCSSHNNLLGYLSCADAKVIREVIASAKVADTCLHCGTDRESRTHVRYECPQWRRYTRQISLTIARHLASYGDSFWFDPRSRCQPMPLDDNGHHVRDIWGFQSSTPPTGPNLCVMHEYPNQRLPWDRAWWFHSMWQGPRTSDGVTRFNNQVRRLVHECVSPGHQAAIFSVVAQIPLELRVWLRDEFDLQGEAVTTALTASNVFSQPPGVVGSAWDLD